MTAPRKPSAAQLAVLLAYIDGREPTGFSNRETATLRRVEATCERSAWLAAAPSDGRVGARLAITPAGREAARHAR